MKHYLPFFIPHGVFVSSNECSYSLSCLVFPLSMAPLIYISSLFSPKYMGPSSCFVSSQVCVSLRIDRPSLSSTTCSSRVSKIRCIALENGRKLVRKDMKECIHWSFLGGSRIITGPTFGRNILCKRSSVVHASWLNCSQIANSAFTLGTAAVLPYYTFMVVAPNAEFTKKVVGSSIPYVSLGILYAYLLYLSWTPDTVRLMFASKYLLPELPGIAKMFSSEMTLASAWIHLLAVDLFAARQVYYEGLKDNIETRHSVSLCLLFCPVGVLAHFVTKAATGSRGKSEH